MKKLLMVAIVWLPAVIVHGHDAPHDGYGCHYDQNVGGYHCHKGMFAGHYFESKEEMLHMLQLHITEPRPLDDVLDDMEDASMESADDSDNAED